MQTAKEFREVLKDAVEFVGKENFLEEKFVVSYIKDMNPESVREIKHLKLLYSDGIMKKIYTEMMQNTNDNLFIGKYSDYLVDMYGIDVNIAKTYLEAIYYALGGRTVDGTTGTISENVSVGKSLPNLEVQFQKGLEAYNSKDYELAFQIMKEAAEQGHAEAACYVGYMYADGTGAVQNKTEAAKWYRNSAEKGNARGQNALGFIYNAGEGIERNDKEALIWYHKAANQGYYRAMHNIGYSYERGEGVDKDIKEAMKWYEKAANLGYADSMCNLGRIYEKSKEIDQDKKEALKWYLKAAEHGDVKAQFNIATLYDEFDNMEEALKWYQKAADCGIRIAQIRLQSIQRRGWENRKMDIKEIMKTQLEQAEAGDAAAQYFIGLSYQLGTDVPKDLALARKWYQKSAEQGYELASEKLRLLNVSEPVKSDTKQKKSIFKSFRRKEA